MKPQEEYIAHYNSESGQASSIQDINKSQFNNLSEINSLDKVRDILFGNQMREVERKFARLEERLIKECTNLRDETRKRLDSLESYFIAILGYVRYTRRGTALPCPYTRRYNVVPHLNGNCYKTEIESLAKQVNNEQGERGQALKALTEQHKNITTPFSLEEYPFNEPPFSQRETLRERVRQSPIVTESGATAVDGSPGIKQVASKTGAGLTKTRSALPSPFAQRLRQEKEKDTKEEEKEDR